MAAIPSNADAIETDETTCNDPHSRDNEHDHRNGRASRPRVPNRGSQGRKHCSAKRRGSNPQESDAERRKVFRGNHTRLPTHLSSHGEQQNGRNQQRDGKGRLTCHLLTKPDKTNDGAGDEHHAHSRGRTHRQTDGPEGPLNAQVARQLHADSSGNEHAQNFATSKGPLTPHQHPQQKGPHGDDGD